MQLHPLIAERVVRHAFEHVDFIGIDTSQPLIKQSHIHLLSSVSFHKCTEDDLWECESSCNFHLEGR